MKSILIKKLNEEFGVKSYMGKSIKLYNFYVLCSLYKKLKNENDINEQKYNILFVIYKKLEGYIWS